METMQELKAKSYDVIQRLNQIDMYFKQANDEMNAEYQKQITPLRIQLDELNGKMRALDMVQPTAEDINPTTTNILPEGSIDAFKEKKNTAKKKVTPKKK